MPESRSFRSPRPGVSRRRSSSFAAARRCRGLKPREVALHDVDEEADGVSAAIGLLPNDVGELVVGCGAGLCRGRGRRRAAG